MQDDPTALAAGTTRVRVNATFLVVPGEGEAATMSFSMGAYPVRPCPPQMHRSVGTPKHVISGPLCALRVRPVDTLVAHQFSRTGTGLSVPHSHVDFSAAPARL